MDGELGPFSVDTASVDTASMAEFGDTSVDKFVDTASVDARDSVDEELNFTALQTFCPGKNLLENSICTAWSST